MSGTFVAASSSVHPSTSRASAMMSTASSTPSSSSCSAAAKSVSRLRYSRTCRGADDEPTSLMSVIVPASEVAPPPPVPTPTSTPGPTPTPMPTPVPTPTPTPMLRETDVPPAAASALAALPGWLRWAARRASLHPRASANADTDSSKFPSTTPDALPAAPSALVSSPDCVRTSSKTTVAQDAGNALPTARPRGVSKRPNCKSTVHEDGSPPRGSTASEGPCDKP